MESVFKRAETQRRESGEPGIARGREERRQRRAPEVAVEEGERDSFDSVELGFLVDEREKVRRAKQS